MLELTIPFNSPDSLRTVQIGKTNKVNYQQLQNDLEALDWITNFTTLEIVYWVTISMYHQDRLLDDCSKVAIHGSYQIFLARSSAFCQTNSFNDNQLVFLFFKPLPSSPSIALWNLVVLGHTCLYKLVSPPSSNQYCFNLLKNYIF